MMATSCKSDKTELIGFGKYKIGVTTPADSYVMGRCEPRGPNTFCFLNRSPSIAGHKTQTDLYFRGHEEKAPLIEISVGVWDCQVGPVSADLEKKLGAPAERGDKTALWRLKKMTVVALLPKDKDLCMVHFLDPADAKRIDSLYSGNVAPKEEPAPSTDPNAVEDFKASTKSTASASESADGNSPADAAPAP